MRFAEARRSDQGLVVLAVASGLLVVWGAFALLQYTEDEDLTLFWIRMAAGVAATAATVWAAVHARWLLTAFLALACCITPVGQGWAWVQLLCVVLAVWALARFFGDAMRGNVND